MRPPSIPLSRAGRSRPVAPRLVAAAVAAGLLGPGAPAAAGSTQPSCPPGPLELPTPAGGPGEALDLTGPRLIVGAADSADGTRRAVRWVDGRVEDLGTPGPLGSEALDVNTRGTIVGAYGLQGSEAELRTQRAFAWSRGRLSTLPGLPGGSGTYARRVNDHGVVAGIAIGGDDREHAVLWRGGRIHPLPVPNGYEGSYALGINDRGDVVGGAYDEDSGDAVRWSRGRFTVLDTLGGPSAGANVIDGRGRAAGIADTAEPGVSEATVWSRHGTPRGLGVLPGGSFSFALGANGHGDYVGIANLPGDDDDHVVVSRDGGPLATLPSLAGGATGETKGHGIDRRGNVAGSSVDAQGRKRPVLWPCAFAQAFVPEAGA